MSITTTTHTTRPLYTSTKNDKDNYLLPLCRQDTKTGKDSKKVSVPCGLLIVLRLLVVVAGLLIIIIVVIESTSGTDTKSG
jgi:hypothetical protein